MQVCLDCFNKFKTEVAEIYTKNESYWQYTQQLYQCTLRGYYDSWR